MRALISFVVLFVGIIMSLPVYGQTDMGYAEEYVFPKVKSAVTLPLAISIKEVNSLINQSVTGILYEDDSYTDNDNDQFKTRVEKDGNIVLAAIDDSRLRISVPLKIWASQGYGGLGYYAYQDVNFAIVMNFVTDIQFNPDWTLTTFTQAEGFEWTEKPVLDFKVAQISLAPLIEERLAAQQREFTGVIDDNIKESFDLKPHLLDVWNQFGAPIQISEEFNTWLKLTPEKVYLTPVKIQNGYIITVIGIDLYSETFVDRMPASAALATTVPNFQYKEKLSQVFKLQTTANISFEDANRMAREQFVGYKFALSGKKENVTITDVRIYPEKNGIVLEMDTKGKVNGTATLRGLPVYDEAAGKIKLAETKFNLKTSNVLQKTLSMLFVGKIKKMITEEYGIPVGDLINASRESLTESFNKEYFPGILLHGVVLDLKPSQFLISKDFMTAVIDTTAVLRLEIKGLDFGE